MEAAEWPAGQFASCHGIAGVPEFRLPVAPEKSPALKQSVNGP